MKELEDKYIELLLKRCVHFKTDKSLLIYVDLKEHLPVAEKVKKKALNMGILDVCININDVDDIYTYLKETRLEDIKLQSCFDRSDWDKYAIKGGALLILSSNVPNLMNDIDPAKIQKMNTLRNESRPYYRNYVSQYKFPWCIAALPNERWAKSVFPNDDDAYHKLYMNIIKMCMVDKEDPILAWENYIQKNNYYKNKLNELKITKMHYTNSLGTDLYVEKPQDCIWLNLDKTDFYGNKIISNMPSYEIFTTPDYRKTNGIVYSSRPLFYNGVCINNFFIKFKDGKVIDCGAETGEDILKSLIFNNKNACYLGEVALVPYNSPISNTGIVFKEILYDENASCHLALGNGFEKCFPNYKTCSEQELISRGCNKAFVHTDFMVGSSDLSIEADTIKGKVLIFKNGNFNI